MQRKQVTFMTTNEIIAALRSAMTAAGADAYYIPSSDPHMSEYLPAHWQTRAWASGFTGSAGTLVITRTESAVWADGRYFIQAAKQLAGSEITLMKMGQPGVPTVAEYLADKLPAHGVLALDGNVSAVSAVEEFETACKKKEISVLDADFVTSLWENRPLVPATPVYAHAVEFAGKSVREKLDAVRADLQTAEADVFLCCRLDSAVWLMNIRASDIDYNPFALCYVFVTQQDAVLFINETRVPQDVRDMLAQAGVSLRAYEETASFLRDYKTGAAQVTLLVNKASTNYTLMQAINANSGFSVKAGEDPIQLLKGIKSDAEVAGLKCSHARDGVAMVRFQMRLEVAMAQGTSVKETDVEDWLREERLAQKHCVGESFNTIAAYGGNAAMMHYSAKPDTCATLAPRGFLLVDSGAQYLDGTTDITRTYALGALTDDECRYYTLVLKSHIQLAMAVFLEGCTGGNLDILARSPMWKEGLDYRCGTGHGVGYLGGVHEGPQSMRINNNVKFVPGMTITDEPGYYEEGKVGIRIENELVCVRVRETEYGKFLGFETFTYCPIDTAPVIVSMLADDELNWLNAYHARVFETLAPRLTEQETQWLREKTKPLAR